MLPLTMSAVLPPLYDLTVGVLNDQLEIAASSGGGKITPDVYSNISACSDMRAVVREAQTRKFGSRMFV